MKQKKIKLFIAVRKGGEVKLIHPDEKRNGWVKVGTFSKKLKYLKHKKLSGINDQYILFEDGTVWSEYSSGRFMSIHKQKIKENHIPHFSVKLSTEGRKYKGIQISRLIFFYFGKHNYKNIDDLPLLTFKDGNPGNISLENLKIAEVGEIAKKSMKKRGAGYQSKIPDTEEDIDFVKKSLEKYPGNLIIIANVYNCSTMSVIRFIRRNKIPYISKYKNKK